MKRAARFFMKRTVLFMINVLAGPPDSGRIQGVRRHLLSCLGTRIGKESQISESFYIYDGRNLTLGVRCRLGAFARIWDFSPIQVGDDFLASHNLTLISATHELNQARTNRPGPITIGNNVWLGVNVTIVGPVAIGDNAIVGANSLVLKDIPANSVYAGSPARLIKQVT